MYTTVHGVTTHATNGYCLMKKAGTIGVFIPYNGASIPHNHSVSTYYFSQIITNKARTGSMPITGSYSLAKLIKCILNTILPGLIINDGFSSSDDDTNKTFHIPGIETIPENDFFIANS